MRVPVLFHMIALLVITVQTDKHCEAFRLHAFSSINTPQMKEIMSFSSPKSGFSEYRPKLVKNFILFRPLTKLNSFGGDGFNGYGDDSLNSFRHQEASPAAPLNLEMNQMNNINLIPPVDRSYRDELIRNLSAVSSLAFHPGAKERRNQQYPQYVDLSRPFDPHPEMIQSIIREWASPLPMTYVKRPLVFIRALGFHGKSLLISALFQDFSRYFKRITTYTTSPLKSYQWDNTTYHRVDRETFSQMKESDQFFETTIIRNENFGLTKEIWTKDILNATKIPFLQLDYAGAQAVYMACQGTSISPRFVVFGPDNLDQYKDQLRRRRDMNEEKWEMFTEYAKDFIDAVKRLDCFENACLINYQADSAKVFRKYLYKFYPSLPSISGIRLLRLYSKSLKTRPNFYYNNQY